MAKKLDAHAKPPEKLREVYKEYQKLKPTSLKDHPGLIQVNEGLLSSNDQASVAERTRLPTELRDILLTFLRDQSNHDEDDVPSVLEHMPVYQVPNIPGKRVFRYSSSFQISEKGRPSDLSLPLSTPSTALPPGQTPSSGHIQPSTQDKRPPASLCLVSTGIQYYRIKEPFFLLRPKIIQFDLHPEGCRRPQTSHNHPLPREEASLVHPRRSV